MLPPILKLDQIDNPIFLTHWTVWTGNTTYKYLGIALFFLTVLFLLFGLGIWMISISTMLFLGFSHAYLDSYGWEPKVRPWEGMGTNFHIVFVLFFAFWFGIGAMCVLFMFFEFFFFSFRILNRWNNRDGLVSEVIIPGPVWMLAGGMLILYLIIL